MKEPIMLESGELLSQSGDEIDLKDLFSALWKGKWITLAVTIVFSVASVFYAINQPNVYRAEVLLASSSKSSSGGLSEMARQFGGLATLAGINLGAGNSGDKTSLAIEVMKSRNFITEFIQRYDILVPLMAASSWNQQSNSLIINNELFDSVTNQWVRKVGPTKTPEPSMWEAHKAFKGVFSVRRSKETGMVTVSIDHYSPFIAKEWVEWLVKDINAEMKQSDLVEAKNSIKFLKLQLENTQITEMQNVFYQLIEEQTKTIMLSEVREEYVFTTVDPAVVPEEKVKPKRALICVVGTLLGAVLGSLLGGLYGMRRKRNNND